MTTDAIASAPAGEAAEVGGLYVLFLVAGVTYALPAEDVIQMESYAGATPVPGTQPFVAGIMQLRGRVVPVVDVRARFGLPAAERTMDTRVVVGEYDGRYVALVVDAAREVARIGPSELAPPPRLVDTGARRFVRALAQLDDRPVIILDFAKLIGEEPIDA